MITIQVSNIGGMMDPMVRRCVKNEFYWRRKLFDQVGVYPELVDQIDTHHGEDHHDIKTK